MLWGGLARNRVCKLCLSQQSFDMKWTLDAEPAGNKKYYCKCCDQYVTYKTLNNHSNSKHVPKHIQAANTVKTVRAAKKTIMKARQAIVRQSKKVLSTAKKVVDAIRQSPSPAQAPYNSLFGSPMSVDAPVADGPGMENLDNSPPFSPQEHSDVNDLLASALGEWREQLDRFEDAISDASSLSSRGSSSSNSLVSIGDPLEGDCEIQELLAAAGLEEQLRNEFAVHPETERGNL
ncbi:hypothetical protein BKA70DRAFT_351098 [Coprinopsis sp. MPI-PUGE-AT-0042]|nr:hypothetical protein BKA70DRAFT_351098 [Coprinopsis sp. MPI-PUGE-AT-0042]